MTTSDISAYDSFQKAKRIADSIRASLPKQIEAGSLTLKSKLPFKALSIREALIHRVSALASPAVSMFESKEPVAAIVLTRAVQETVAVTFALYREIESFLATKSREPFDEFLMACLVGSRLPNSPTPARNVLTMIDHVDKKFEGFRATYDSLCEFAHPNWSGALGAFGTIDQEQHILSLGPRDRQSIYVIGVTSLAMSLSLFEHIYNDLIEPITSLNSYFESGVE